MEEYLKIIVGLYQQLLAKIKSKMSPSEQLAKLAESKIGTDFTNDATVPDEVSCAFAVSTILKEHDADIPIILGTNALWRFMQNSPKFERIYEPERGCIVISPTGTSTKSIMPNGHTGIYIDEVRILSNSSIAPQKGQWINNYTRESWRERYHYLGGYPVYLFKKVA